MLLSLIQFISILHWKSQDRVATLFTHRLWLFQDNWDNKGLTPNTEAFYPVYILCLYWQQLPIKHSPHQTRSLHPLLVTHQGATEVSWGFVPSLCISILTYANVIHESIAIHKTFSCGCKRVKKLLRCVMANFQRRSHALTSNCPFTFGQRGLLSLKSYFNNVQGRDCNVNK